MHVPVAPMIFPRMQVDVVLLCGGCMRQGKLHHVDQVMLWLHVPKADLDHFVVLVECAPRTVIASGVLSSTIRQ